MLFLFAFVATAVFGQKSKTCLSDSLATYKDDVINTCQLLSENRMLRSQLSMHTAIVERKGESPAMWGASGHSENLYDNLVKFAVDNLNEGKLHGDILAFNYKVYDRQFQIADEASLVAALAAHRSLGEILVLTAVHVSKMPTTSPSVSPTDLYAMVVNAGDTRLGCPPALEANKPIILKEMTFEHDVAVTVWGHVIRHFQGRADLYLKINNSLKDQSLSHTIEKQWDDVVVHWAGNLKKGKHVFTLSGNVPNAWGCQQNWGDLDIIIHEEGTVVYNVPDNREGCPPAAAANSVLLQKKVTIKEDKTPVEIMAHMIRSHDGRADLQLFNGAVLLDQALTWTSGKQWEDAVVHWVGYVNKGEHTFYLRSPSASLWGCQGTWGDLDIVVYPKTVQVYQTPDTQAGCPAERTNVLVTKTIQVAKDKTQVAVTGHMISKKAGRSDMQLKWNNQFLDQSLEFTKDAVWNDVVVHWVGKVNKGEHTFTLTTGNPNAFGCGQSWGDLDIVVWAGYVLD